MKPKYGYCAVTADFLHIGHLNFIRQAKEKCEKLIVGVMSDECVEGYKGKKPFMSERQRMDLVRSIRYVDSVHLQNSYQFDHHVFRLKEMYGNDFVVIDSKEHKRPGADFYLPRKSGISSKQYKNENPDYRQFSL